MLFLLRMAFEFTKTSSYTVVIIIHVLNLRILQYLHKWTPNAVNYVSYYYYFIVINGSVKM